MCPGGVSVETGLAAVLAAMVPAHELNGCHAIFGAFHAVFHKVAIGNGVVLLGPVNLKLEPRIHILHPRGKNSAVLSCGAFIPTSTDQIPRARYLKRMARTEPECPPGMMGLCQLYVKNKVVLSCKQK